MKHLEIVNSKAKNPSTGSFDNGLWGGIGINGKSVVSGEIAANGHLIFTLSDNSQIDCGVVDNLFGFDDVPTLGSDNLVNSGHIKLALNQKVDIVAGKGLSTEDYTTAEKEKVAALGAAATKGVDTSPTASSTNLVESGGVATALAGKQATLTTAQQAAVDSGITSAKVTQYDKDSAATAELVDSGAKNLFNITKETTTQYGVTFTNNGDGTVTSSGTLDEGKAETYLGLGGVDLPAGNYVFTSAEGASFSGYDSYVYISGSNPIETIARDIDGYHDFTLTEPTRVVVRIRVRAGHEAATFSPMICTKAMSNISGAFEPYAPTNRELYEMIGDINSILEEVL